MGVKTPASRKGEQEWKNMPGSPFCVRPGKGTPPVCPPSLRINSHVAIPKFKGVWEMQTTCVPREGENGLAGTGGQWRSPLQSFLPPVLCTSPFPRGRTCRDPQLLSGKASSQPSFVGL